MSQRSLLRTVLGGVFLLLLLGGAAVGAWNYQEIQSCHRTYDDEPDTFVECKDAFTVIVYGLSIIGLTSGLGGLVWLRRAG